MTLSVDFLLVDIGLQYYLSALQGRLERSWTVTDGANSIAIFNRKWNCSEIILLCPKATVVYIYCRIHTISGFSFFSCPEDIGIKWTTIWRYRRVWSDSKKT